MFNVQAYFQSVNLSANSLYVPEFASMKYLNYGAAVSEASSFMISFLLFSSVLKVKLSFFSSCCSVEDDRLPISGLIIVPYKSLCLYANYGAMAP